MRGSVRQLAAFIAVLLLLATPGVARPVTAQSGQGASSADLTSMLLTASDVGPEWTPDATSVLASPDLGLQIALNSFRRDSTEGGPYFVGSAAAAAQANGASDATLDAFTDTVARMISVTRGVAAGGGATEFDGPSLGDATRWRTIATQENGIEVETGLVAFRVEDRLAAVFAVGQDGEVPYEDLADWAGIVDARLVGPPV